MKVLVLGAGKMVRALLHGLKKHEDLREWGIYSPSGVSAKKLAAECGAQFVSDLSGISEPDWIILGHKPAQISELSETLKGRFKESLYLSLLAALTEESQCKTLGISKLIRVMPNLNVEYGEGVVLLASHSAQAHLNEVQKTFKSLGSLLVVSEEELEELTLLTGSGPALFYEFTQNLAECFSSLTPKLRQDLARQVLLGAAISSKRESRPLQEMIDAVTSKGGVTIAVLEKWRQKDLKGHLLEGIVAGKLKTQMIKDSLRN